MVGIVRWETKTGEQVARVDASYLNTHTLLLGRVWKL